MNLIINVFWSIVIMSICLSCNETASTKSDALTTKGANIPKKPAAKGDKSEVVSMNDLREGSIMTDKARQALEDMKPGSDANILKLKNNRDHCKNLIAERSKGQKALAMMVHSPLNYQFVFDGKKMSEPGKYDGRWIQFKDDFTYDYGRYKKVNGGGLYHLRIDDLQLIMMDNDESKMPEEWEVKTKDDVQIWVGKDYFGNNPKQMKLGIGPIPTRK